MPAISVITPLFNKGPYIGDTIRSVQAQTVSDWEMIIVDDASTDDSREVVRGFNDARLRVLAANGSGPGAARNLGLAQASGEWIQFLDADDLLEPEHLAAQLRVAAQHPSAGIIAGGWQEFYGGQPERRVQQPPAGSAGNETALRDAAIAFAPWAVHAALVKRSRITPECLWAVEFDRLLGEDIVFWFRLVTTTEVAYSPAQSALYRRLSPNCRTDLRPESWYEGVHAAILSNLEFLRCHGLEPAAGQCASLMYVYSSIHQMAAAGRASEIKSKALAEARRWLREYFHKGGASLPAMLVRRMIGLKLFLWISRLAGTPSTAIA